MTASLFVYVTESSVVGLNDVGVDQFEIVMSAVAAYAGTAMIPAQPDRTRCAHVRHTAFPFVR